jgi:hypothetical protein
MDAIRSRPLMRPLTKGAANIKKSAQIKGERITFSNFDKTKNIGK